MSTTSSTRTMLLPAVLLATLGACGRPDSQAAAAQAEEERVVACDLITAAEATAMLGDATAERTSRQSADASICTLTGTNHTVLLRVFQPFHGGASNSAGWVARLQAERAEERERESDPDLKKALGEIRIVPYDRLGVPAAREDVFDEVTLHALKGGAGGFYLSVHASDLDVAHRIAEAALAKIR